MPARGEGGVGLGCFSFFFGRFVIIFFVLIFFSKSHFFKFSLFCLFLFSVWRQ